jgi:5-methylcytosine-specific restriction endonuclease McrA
MIYSQQLKTGNWQERRLRIFERDAFCCTQCGSKNDLQVHHKDYFPGKMAWEYPDQDLVTLCGKCHTEEGKRETHERYLLQSLKNSGFSSFEVLALSSYLDKYRGFAKDVKNLINNAIEANL